MVNKFVKIWIRNFVAFLENLNLYTMAKEYHASQTLVTQYILYSFFVTNTKQKNFLFRHNTRRHMWRKGKEVKELFLIDSYFSCLLPDMEC